MDADSARRFSFPAICRKKVAAAFDGGRLTSDGGVLVLGQAERQLGVAQQLAACIADCRDQSRVVHDLADILRARMLAIDGSVQRRHDWRLDAPTRCLRQVHPSRAAMAPKHALSSFVKSAGCSKAAK